MSQVAPAMRVAAVVTTVTSWSQPARRLRSPASTRRPMARSVHFSSLTTSLVIRDRDTRCEASSDPHPKRLRSTRARRGNQENKREQIMNSRFTSATFRTTSPRTGFAINSPNAAASPTST